jgi:hypothetical protein
MKKASLVENSTNSSEFSSTLNTTHHLTTWPACWRSPLAHRDRDEEEFFKDESEEIIEVN